MANGIVHFFNKHKGFGLVSRDVGGDVSVHFFAVQDTSFKHVPDGHGVEFDLVRRTGHHAPDLPVL